MSVYIKRRNDEETFEAYCHIRSRSISDLCAIFPDLSVVHEDDGLYVSYKGATGNIRKTRLEHGDVIVKSLTDGLYETYTNDGFHAHFQEKPPVTVEMNPPGMNEALRKAWEAVYAAYQALESVRPAGGFQPLGEKPTFLRKIMD